MTDALPLSARWLSAASVAALLDCEPRQVRERFALRPDFPRSVRPGGTGHPRWNAAEVSSALVERHGLTAAGRMLARLMREAGDAYRERS